MAGGTPPPGQGGDGDPLFRAVIEAALDAIVVIDRNGAIRSVNMATEQIFGYTPKSSSAATSKS